MRQQGHRHTLLLVYLKKGKEGNKGFKCHYYSMHGWEGHWFKQLISYYIYNNTAGKAHLQACTSIYIM